MFSFPRLPPVAVSAAFLLALVCMYGATRHLTGGLFVYPLDDSYIHLLLARTLASSGTWGVRAGEFASASSSPGWTVVLTLVSLVVGTHLLTPLLLNAALGVVLIFALDWGLRVLRPQSGAMFRTAMVLLVVLAAPLTNLAFLGMEHVAQALSMLLLVVFGARVLGIAPREALPRRLVVGVVVSALAAGAIRYEAVFAIAPLLLGLLWRRRFGVAAMVAVAGAAGPVGFGVFSYRYSGLWLPFSVLMKQYITTPPPELSLLRRLMLQTGGGIFRPAVLMPMLLFGVRLRRYGVWAPTQVTLLLSACVTGLHLLLAPTRWLMRYDAYFIALFLFAMAAALPPMRPWREMVDRLKARTGYEALLAIVLVAAGLRLADPMLYQMAEGVVRGPQASHDRFEEHIQMARFAERFYDRDTIAVNDIGAVGFYSGARLLDVAGLASGFPVTRLHSGHPMTAADLDGWVRSEGASIAILQPQWFYIQRVLPRTWVPVGQWGLTRNIVFADLTVGFYAIDPAAVPRLCESLRAYPLPRGVTLRLTPGVCPAAPGPVPVR